MATDIEPRAARNDGLPPPAAPSRRSALKVLGVGGATVLVAATGVLSYRAFDNGVLDAGAGTPYDGWSQWQDDNSPLGAVGAAILAANPHNTQPWLFHVTATSVDVFVDPARDMPFVDPLRREHHVGLGCAVENLVLALGARGFRPTVNLMPDAADQSHVASLLLVPAPARTSPLHDAIGARHSNRGPYLARNIPTAVLDELTAHGTDLPGIGTRWFTSADEKTALGMLIIAATEAFIADPQQSQEAFGWFRNNRDDIDEHRDGPTLDAQGLSPITLTLAKLLPASSRTAGDAFWLDQTRTVHTATAAAYGVITVADPDDPATRLTAGRALQRIHLAATTLGLGLQHMNQITERIDRERRQGVPATFEPRLRNLLAQPGRQPLVTFRLGYPVRAGRPSPRRPLAAVIR
ncbi:MAG: hypothetical protein QOI78_2465 [Actinomycetota bacterium]|nr:hypothetical protein [Actinomycetota bacterium]